MLLTCCFCRQGLVFVVGCLTVDKVFAGEIVDEDGGASELGLHEGTFDLWYNTGCCDVKLIDGDL